MKKLLLLLILIFAPLVYADIYMHKDADGNITYSDEQTSQAEKIYIATSPIPEEKTQAENKQETPSAEAEDNAVAIPGERKPYQTFMIISPKDQESIQNQPTVTVSLEIQPALQEGDKVQVFVDDKPWGQATASALISLGRIERGTHRISAALINQSQQVLKLSQTITIYIHQAHIGNPAS